MSIILLGIAVFISTNLDDIFILMAFFADRKFTHRQVIIGQYLGIGALTLLSIAASLMALVIPQAWIGALGIFPLVIGLSKLIDLMRGEKEETAVRSSGVQMLSIAAVTFSNGGDNLGVYIPLFANSSAAHIALLAATFLLMTGLWCALGYYLVNNPFIGAQIKRYGRILLPFVLILLGISILAQLFQT